MGYGLWQENAMKGLEGKIGEKRPAYIIIKNNLNKNLKTFLENNHIKSYNWKFFIANKSNPLIYAIPKFWSRFSFSDTKIAKKVTSRHGKICAMVGLA